MVENKRNVLLFGGSGKLGSAILSLKHPNLDIFAPTHAQCSLNNEKEVYQTVIRTRPDIIINTAAIVGTKECEQNPELSWATNVLGPLCIAKICSGEGIRHIFISSAAIFNGEKGNYAETDPPSPIFFYAITKVAAEQAVSTNPDHAIIRLDFFPLTNLKYKKVFVDHYTSKIPVPEAAQKIIQVCTSAFIGILNIGQERNSLYEILKPYFPDITPIKIADSSLPKFPRDISLDLSLWKKRFELAIN